jgi:hypothetical protein
MQQIVKGEDLDGLCKVKVVTGAGAGATVDLADSTASEIVCVLAFVTATGAGATKTLLAATTDYTYSTVTGLITCVTNQSANTLMVTYK